MKNKQKNEPAKDTPSDQCLVPWCDKPITCRGLCRTHYQMMVRAVASGLTSYEALEKSGKITTTTYGHFSKWLLPTDPNKKGGPQS
jgi:hypothetical protein